MRAVTMKTMLQFTDEARSIVERAHWQESFWRYVRYALTHRVLCVRMLESGSQNAAMPVSPGVAAVISFSGMPAR